MALSFDEGRPTALLPYSPSSGRPGGSYDIPGRIQARLGFGSTSRWRNVVTVGSWNSSLSLPTLCDDLPEVARAPMLARLMNAVLNRTDKPVAWPFLQADLAREILDALPEAVALRDTPNTCALIPRVPYRDYMDELSRNRRRTMNRESDLLRQSYIVSVQGLIGVLDEAASLIENIKEKHGVPIARGETLRLLELDAKVFGDSAIAFCAHDDRGLRAVATAIRHHGKLYMRHFGNASDNSGTHAEYFCLAYHEPIRYCLAHQLDTAIAGPSTYKAKLLRGFAPVPTWTLLMRPDRVEPDEVEAVVRYNAKELDGWNAWYRRINPGAPLPPEWHPINEHAR